MASRLAPRYLESAHITPWHSVGLGDETTLKATFWQAVIRETPQAGDPDFVSIALNTGGGRVWRNREPVPTEAGAIALQPFEGATWRFEPGVSFTHLYVPFAIADAVCRSLYDRPLRHEDLWMQAAIADPVLCATAAAVQQRLLETEPTNLLLDCWALLLAEALVRRSSTPGQRPLRHGPGHIPARGIARAVDFIEAHLDGDLRLEALAQAAAMSLYHFAHSFRLAVGMSPHAYVLARRLRRAEDLLRRGDAGLTEIALSCGFASQAHFTTAFQRATGVPPGVYRRLLRS